MRKTILTLAALAAIGMVVPYAAPAKADNTVIVHKHRHRLLNEVVPPSRHHREHNTVIIKHND